MGGCNLVPHLEYAMQLLGRRWVAMVLFSLLDGPRRFSEIEAGLPISGRLLSERLKELEAEGLVSRAIFAEVPVRVEYELTDKGRAMGPIFRAVADWAWQWCCDGEPPLCPGGDDPAGSEKAKT